MRAANLGAFVPVDAQPAEAVEDRLQGLVDVPLLIGVVDPQDELPAVRAGEQPAEQGRADPADVQVAGRTGSKSRANRHGNCVVKGEIGFVIPAQAGTQYWTFPLGSRLCGDDVDRDHYPRRADTTKGDARIFSAIPAVLSGPVALLLAEAFAFGLREGSIVVVLWVAAIDPGRFVFFLFVCTFIGLVCRGLRGLCSRRDGRDRVIVLDQALDIENHIPGSEQATGKREQEARQGKRTGDGPQPERVGSW